MSKIFLSVSYLNKTNRVAQVFERISLFWQKQQQQTDKQDLLSLVRQIVKFCDTWNLEIVVGSCEQPIFTCISELMLEL